MTQPRLACYAYALSAAVVIGMAVHAGIFRPFTQVYDADLHYLYRALRFNSGLEQKYFDHTGYLYALILSWWLEAVRLFGLIPAATLEEVRNSAFPGHAMAVAIHAGRVLSILLALIYVAAVGFACARLSGSRLVGAGAALLLAPTVGIAYHAITLRPELVSALTLAMAFIAVLLSNAKGERQRLLLLGLSAGFAYLSVLAKMQSVIPLLFLPLVGLACRPAAADSVAQVRPIGPDTVCLFLLAIVVFLPFATSHYFGVTELGRRSVPIYSWGLALYVLAGLLAYRAAYRTTAGSTVNAVSAVMLGLGLTYFITFFNHSDALAVANVTFLDNLKLYGGSGSGKLMTDLSFSGTAGYFELASGYAHKLHAALDQLVDFKASGQVTETVLVLFAVASGVFAYRAGQGQKAIPIAILVLAYFGTRTAFLFRSNAPFYEPYFIFFPLFALALAWPVLSSTTVRRPPRSVAIAAALLMAVVAGLQLAQSARQARTRTPHVSAGHFCEFQRTWAPILRDDKYVGDICWPIYARAIDPRALPSLGIMP